MSSADGADMVRARLEARARALAARPAYDVLGESDRDAVRFIVFRRGNERFALPLADVVEVARDVRVTPLLGAGAPVTGLAGWRGRVLTVLDLNPGGAVPAHLVVAGAGRAAFAIVADELEDASALVADPGTPAESSRAAWATGVTRDAVVIVDYALLQGSLT